MDLRAHILTVRQKLLRSARKQVRTLLRYQVMELKHIWAAPMDSRRSPIGPYYTNAWTALLKTSTIVLGDRTMIEKSLPAQINAHFCKLFRCHADIAVALFYRHILHPSAGKRLLVSDNALRADPMVSVDDVEMSQRHTVQSLTSGY